MQKQQGSVIIVTLWTITLLTILIAVIAGQIRLSAQAAYYHKDELGTWANILAAVNQAEMELMLERMDLPVQSNLNLNDVGINPRYRYNGQELELNYPQAEGISVRIYDHAGKINLREIGRPRMRALLEKLLGEDGGEQKDEQIDDLIAAWGDWLDLNSATGINGAEEDYYQSLDAPYMPRNGKLETVEEIMLVRGFAEVFADLDLDAAFTLYTDSELVNLNLATVEAMRLLPGMDDELIEAVLEYRAENEFRGNGDVAQVIPAENMAELRPWLNSRKTSNFYSILVYEKTDSETGIINCGADNSENLPGQEDLSTTAFSEIVEIAGFSQRPKTLKVNPYQNIPIRWQVQPD